MSDGPWDICAFDMYIFQFDWFIKTICRSVEIEAFAPKIILFYKLVQIV